MRILLITQWFDPEPALKGLAFARALQSAGHDVDVLTGFPNYPGGRLYPGYRIRPWQIEMMEGVRVVRVPLYPSHDGSAWRRALNYLSFLASAAILGPLLTRRPDVVYVYHPPATAGLAAAILATLRRVPLVYDIQDLWPDTLAATGMVRQGRLLRVVGGVCRALYRRAARIVVLSPGFARRLAERGVPLDKIDVIHNWCDERTLRAAQDSPAPLAMSGKFNVVFAGTMGAAQALESVLQAAQQVADQRDDVQFVLVGGGIERARLLAMAQWMGLPNVVFLPPMPMKEIGAVLAAADVLLVHLRNDPLFEITIPSKIQAYLAAGRPLLNGVPGDAADLVRRAEAGLNVPPEDPAALAQAVLALAHLPPASRLAMGVAGRDFYDRELALSIGAARTINTLERARRR
ncbi:glycosyl transferase [Bordetella ansorpii]|uniref:Glycosyl transferase n=1 Tax=Bordetella ansorpii TaxID=288768 RepID=A0A146AWD0_9BORD|nr:glycosyltransferase family 4 protein [Bordetella ansorpii]CZZ93810.1 glycosyl transferase [Bordetella ansorpii]